MFRKIEGRPNRTCTAAAVGELLMTSAVVETWSRGERERERERERGRNSIVMTSPNLPPPGEGELMAVVEKKGGIYGPV